MNDPYPGWENKLRCPYCGRVFDNEDLEHEPDMMTAGLRKIISEGHVQCECEAIIVFEVRYDPAEHPIHIRDAYTSRMCINCAYAESIAEDGSLMTCSRHHKEVKGGHQCNDFIDVDDCERDEP